MPLATPMIKVPIAQLLMSRVRRASIVRQQGHSSNCADRCAAAIATAAADVEKPLIGVVSISALSKLNARTSRNALHLCVLLHSTTQINAVRNHGGPTVSIRLHGMNYDEASDEAYRLVKEEGLTLIHPFDDPEVDTPTLSSTGTHSELPVSTLNVAVFCCAYRQPLLVLGCALA